MSDLTNDNLMKILEDEDLMKDIMQDLNKLELMRNYNELQ